MIEIELKFELKNKKTINLKPDNLEEVVDIYYDTHNYQLLKKGNFLRIRNNNSLDFKLNANDLSHLYCKETNFLLDNNNLDEINKIFFELGVNVKLKDLDDMCNDLKVLAPIKKKRASYQLEENVILVIDEVEDLGTFLEIEYDLDSEEIDDVAYYKKYLIDILKQYNLYFMDMREIHIGYVELYLKKYNLEAYKLGIYHE